MYSSSLFSTRTTVQSKQVLGISRNRFDTTVLYMPP